MTEDEMRHFASRLRMAEYDRTWFPYRLKLMRSGNHQVPDYSFKRISPNTRAPAVPSYMSKTGPNGFLFR